MLMGGIVMTWLCHKWLDLSSHWKTFELIVISESASQFDLKLGQDFRKRLIRNVFFENCFLFFFLLLLRRQKVKPKLDSCFDIRPLYARRIARHRNKLFPFFSILLHGGFIWAPSMTPNLLSHWKVMTSGIAGPRWASPAAGFLSRNEKKKQHQERSSAAAAAETRRKRRKRKGK
jgi:hypothetical protein